MEDLISLMSATGAAPKRARPSETKLARLRVRATGQKRKTGLSRTCGSTKAVRNSPDGGPARTIKALPQLYQSEGLPAIQPPKPAEQRAIAGMGLTEFATTLAKPQVIRRTTKPQKN